MPTLGELFTQVINQRVTTAAMTDAIANINSMEIHVCTAGEYNSTTLVPTVATPDASTFYLVPDGSGNNLYTEWVYVNNAWELFGRATIDLSGYALKTEIPDIQVGGTSVINNGVANVPYATADVPGVIKVASGNGIALDSEYLRLYINRADDALVKAGASDVRPIVPSNQDKSVFFGLSKLAGVDLASQTVTVGTYPATSKAAIRNLIGAIATDDLNIQVTADTPVTITFGSATINDDNNVPSATMNATAFEEGLATLVIGTDEIPVHMALTTDNETGKTYYMTTETLQDGTTPVFAAQYTGTAGTSTTVSYMAYSDETYAEAQTIALKYPREKLTTQVPKMYLGTAANGSGGYMVATTDYLETNYAPKHNPIFTGMISMGRNTIYGSGTNSIAVGEQVLAQAQASAAFGIYSQAANKYSFAANRGTYASGESSATFGFKARANGEASFAEGFWTYAGGQYAHVEGEANGVNNMANTAYGAKGRASHAEGGFTIADAGYAHAEGRHTQALATASHAEGDSTIASGYASHAQGYYTKAGFSNQSASGLLNAIDTHKIYPKWAANTSYAVGDRVLYDNDDNTYTDAEDYAIFECRVANNDAEFNWENWYLYDYDMGNFVEIVGNGKWSYLDGTTSTEVRSNARALDWDGNERLMGDVYVGCNADSSGGVKLARIPAAPTTDGTYTLQCVVSSGVPTYSWVSTGA